jgi:hypothetical protein
VRSVETELYAVVGNKSVCIRELYGICVITNNLKGTSINSTCNHFSVSTAVFIICFAYLLAEHYGMLPWKLIGVGYLEAVDIYDKRILKWILKMETMRVWTGFVWL